MADAEPAELGGDGARARRAAPSSNACAQPPVGGVDAQRAARLGIDEGQLADVDEGLLARVGDLDGEDRVARRRRRSAARRQSSGAAEVGDDGHEAGRGPRGGHGPQRVGDRRRRRRPPRAARSASVRSRPSMPLRPPAGGLTDGLARPPKAMTPSRSERRATKRPTTRAAPSATSALRRSAVPKCIEAERSRSSHAVSWRSGTSSRTCGTPLRAVAFQSMRRTSSPGSYGRMRSRSRPAPRPSPRWSPTSRPPERRVRAISRRRTRSSAIGPGPGRAGVRSRPASRQVPASPVGRGRVGGHAVAEGWAARSSCGAGTRPRTRVMTASGVMPSVRAA